MEELEIAEDCSSNGLILRILHYEETKERKL
jgi:hypothetical protein